MLFNVLHGMINKLDLMKRIIFRKNENFYKSLASGALILGIIFVADCQTHWPLLQMLSIYLFFNISLFV